MRMLLKVEAKTETCRPVDPWRTHGNEEPALFLCCSVALVSTGAMIRNNGGLTQTVHIAFYTTLAMFGWTRTNQICGEHNAVSGSEFGQCQLHSSTQDQSAITNTCTGNL